MKKYFILRKSSDAKVIGVKNGITQAKINREGFEKYDELIKHLGSFDSPSKADFFYCPDMEIENVQLLKGAKLTKFLSFEPFLIHCPFLISEDTYSIFKKFNVQDHVAYKAAVNSHGCVYSYFLFYCKSLSKDFVDYSETLFFTGNKITGKNQIKFSSREEETAYIKNVGSNYHLEQITLRSDQLMNQDFIVAPYRDIYVSEELKDELQKNAADGIEFLPAYEEHRDWPRILIY